LVFRPRKLSVGTGDKKGEVIKAFPYGSEEQQRFEQGINEEEN